MFILVPWFFHHAGFGAQVRPAAYWPSVLLQLVMCGSILPSRFALSSWRLTGCTCRRLHPYSRGELSPLYSAFLHFFGTDCKRVASTHQPCWFPPTLTLQNIEICRNDRSQDSWLIFQRCNNLFDPRSRKKVEISNIEWKDQWQLDLSLQMISNYLTTAKKKKDKQT